jgi:hypothetical protein
MKNMNELRSSLADVFDQLREGSIDVKSAGELANIAGKMIKSSAVQVEYYALRKQETKIPFLEEPAAK